MSKRGNGLTILALLIGMGGMGLGVYAVFFMPTIMGQASGDSEISGFSPVCRLQPEL